MSPRQVFFSADILLSRPLPLSGAGNLDFVAKKSPGLANHGGT